VADVWKPAPRRLSHQDADDRGPARIRVGQCDLGLRDLGFCCLAVTRWAVSQMFRFKTGHSRVATAFRIEEGHAFRKVLGVVPDPECG
jgi:hypothetical protein